MKYHLCFTVETLKDAAAFEELAQDLGVEMRLQDVKEAEQPPKPRRTRYLVTPELVAHVKNLDKQHRNWTHGRIAAQSKKDGLPTSPATVGRIRAGQYEVK